MRDLGEIIRQPQIFGSGDIAEMRTAHSKISHFANEEAFRHANVRTSVEVIASTQELIAAIKRFDEASGKMVKRANTECVHYPLTRISAVFSSGRDWQPVAEVPTG